MVLILFREAPSWPSRSSNVKTRWGAVVSAVPPEASLKTCIMPYTLFSGHWGFLDEEMAYSCIQLLANSCIAGLLRVSSDDFVRQRGLDTPFLLDDLHFMREGLHGRVEMMKQIDDVLECA